MRRFNYKRAPINWDKKYGTSQAKRKVYIENVNFQS